MLADATKSGDIIQSRTIRGQRSSPCQTVYEVWNLEAEMERSGEERQRETKGVQTNKWTRKQSKDNDVAMEQVVSI